MEPNGVKSSCSTVFGTFEGVDGITERNDTEVPVQEPGMPPGAEHSCTDRSCLWQFLVPLGRGRKSSDSRLSRYSPFCSFMQAFAVSLYQRYNVLYAVRPCRQFYV